MALLDILIWPDSRLLQKSLPVESVDDEMRELVDEMLETMYDADGVGLAAPQVGILKRLVVVDIHGSEEDAPSGRDPLVLVNPRFENVEGELEWEEGCLSVPGETGMVTRSAKVTCVYEDLDGNEQRLEAEGLKAVALQHECDHLDGKLFVDYIGRMKRTVIRRKMLKLIAQQEEEMQA
ncbi:MAG: peptide deformylase [Deltaproteobacteria bacterium]|nr:peptide deformylase [Deltaproteobacteria bacterium]